MHFRRLSSVLDRSKGEKVDGVIQGRRDAEKRRIEPVVVKGVKAGDSLLEEYVMLVSVYILESLFDVISGKYSDLYYPSLL